MMMITINYGIAKLIRSKSFEDLLEMQGGSNMTGTNSDLFTHK
jgi:hypothetical protein